MRTMSYLTLDISELLEFKDNVLFDFLVQEAGYRTDYSVNVFLRA